MSSFRRRMYRNKGEIKPTYVRTDDDEIIKILTLYDYELEGQVQDEIYEHNGRIQLRKKIVEKTLPVYSSIPVNWGLGFNLYSYIKSGTDLYNVSYDDKNAYYHIIPDNSLTYRTTWDAPSMPQRHIGIIGLSNTFFRLRNDGLYEDKELLTIMSGAQIRIAVDIEEKIKIYEVKELIYE